MADIYTINNLRGSIDFETREYYARTLQNAKNLLCTWKGEIPYDRMAGLDPALISLTFPRLQDILLAEVTRALAWEPDVRVVAARARVVELGVLYVEADVTIMEV